MAPARAFSWPAPAFYMAPACSQQPLHQMTCCTSLLSPCTPHQLGSPATRLEDAYDLHAARPDRLQAVTSSLTLQPTSSHPRQHMHDPSRDSRLQGLFLEPSAHCTSPSSPSTITSQSWVPQDEPLTRCKASSPPPTPVRDR